MSEDIICEIVTKILLALMICCGICRITPQTEKQDKKHKRQSPLVYAQDFNVSAYLSRIEEEANKLLMEPTEPYVLVLWTGIDGLRMNEDGSAEWIRKDVEPIELPFLTGYTKTGTWNTYYQNEIIGTYEYVRNPKSTLEKLEEELEKCQQKINAEIANPTDRLSVEREIKHKANIQKAIIIAREEKIAELKRNIGKIKHDMYLQTTNSYLIDEIVALNRSGICGNTNHTDYSMGNSATNQSTIDCVCEAQYAESCAHRSML